MRYKVTATIDGKRKYFYGKTKKEAEQKRKEYLDTYNKEINLFKTVAAQWWEFKQEEIAYNTTKGYKAAYVRAVDRFGEMDITDIRSAEVANYIRDFAKQGYYDKTVRTQLMIINLIFKYAINYLGIDINNPARDVEIPKRLKKRKVSVPTPKDIEKILNADESLQKKMAMWFMYTGLRKGELLALTSDDINDGFISVTKSLYHDNNQPRLKETKTEKGSRKIPIVKELEKYLPVKDGIIFDEHGRYMRDSVFQKGWYKWCKELGIQCTPHQLRHLYATMLYENGSLSLKDFSFVMGHANISTSLEIYTDIRNQQQKKIAEQLYNIKVTTS